MKTSRVKVIGKVYGVFYGFTLFFTIMRVDKHSIRKAYTYKVPQTKIPHLPS